jgi:membrane carboxypeptidase/penicillin-binding protein
MKRTKNQNRAIHTLCNHLGFDSDDRKQIVEKFSQGRTTSSAELTVEEARRLINDMRENLPQQIYVNSPEEQERDRKRKRVISHLAEAGYIKKDGKHDMDAIHAWVRRQKYKKHLNAHTSKELSTLIYAADAVRQHFLTKIKTDE